MNFTQILLGGWNALLEYLSAHVLTCLVPAFFIAGAIAVFVSQAAVMKYFGAQVKKVLVGVSTGFVESYAKSKGVSNFSSLTKKISGALIFLAGLYILFINL